MESILRGRLWIGGGTCSGKSTLAREVAAVTGRKFVSIDDAFDAHAAELPGSALGRVAAMPVCERLAQDVDLQAADVWSIAEERWPLVLREIGPASAIVEGEAILPSRLAAAGVPREGAMFLVIGVEMRRERYAQRHWARALVANCPDPDAAWEAWMRRDDLVQERIVVEAAEHGYPVFEVDVPDGLAAARAHANRPPTP